MTIKIRELFKLSMLRMMIVDLVAIVIYCSVADLTAHTNANANALMIAADAPVAARVPARPAVYAKEIIVHGKSRREFEQTGCNTDLAIDGNGYFIVKLPASMGYGRGYTRNGCLMRNRNGDLVVAIDTGYRLMPAINIPLGASDISISRDGTVEYLPHNGQGKMVAGQIQLAQFSHPENLWPEGHGVFSETEASGAHWSKHPGEHGAGVLVSGFLEAAAVDSIASVK